MNTTAPEINSILENDIELDISAYPAAIEKCELGISSRKRTLANLKRMKQSVEDDFAREVSEERITYTVGTKTQERKKFSSQEERDREIRFRCYQKHSSYANWEQRINEEEESLAEWKARYNRLRRELRLLEHEYSSTGQRIFQQHTGRSYFGDSEEI